MIEQSTESSKKIFGYSAFSSRIFVFLMLMPFMLPAFLNDTEAGKLFDFYKIIVGCVTVVIFLFQNKLSLGIVSISLFYFSFVITGIIKSGNVQMAVITVMNAVIFSIILTLGLKMNPRVLCDVLTFYIFLLWTGELICLFLFPNGIALSKYYYNAYGFIGIDNQLTPFLIFSFFLILFNLMNKYKPVISAICIIEMFAAAFITWSATCVVVSFILLAYLILFYKKKWEMLLDLKLLFSVVIVLFFALVIFRVHDIFSFFIEDILGKSITLTGRTEIWDLAIYQIKQTPLFGRGFYPEYGWIFWHSKFYYSHNLFLEIMLIGGVFSLAFFAAMIWINFSKIDFKGNVTLAALLSICIFSMGIGCLTEAYLKSVFFTAFFVFAYNFDVLSLYSESCIEKVTMNKIKPDKMSG